ncbi:uncharacterized protein LOC116260352 isoform X2 [Nymphaea colorata]|uniref:uncharacterized protein LOC116260352 isoform X2 n=1 Tax=Nymphaea colorata TaxID=210225 RepID=UPI00129EAE7F|nr:uncharacterized protein LOC116260352 isoform X2 [Nymphaea colorata]
MFFKGFNSSKWKTAIKLAISRIKLLRNKRSAVLKQMKRDVAMLLESGQETSARIRVEHVIREQNIMAANEIIELFCELVIARLSVIESQRGCPIDLKEGISSLIFAAPRCADIPELQKISKLVEKKYGKEFVAGAAELRPDCGVNRSLIERLTVKAPSGETKLRVLQEIAKEYQVKWDSSATERELLKPPEDALEGPTRFQSANSTPAKVVPSDHNISHHHANNMPSKAVLSDHNSSRNPENSMPAKLLQPDHILSPRPANNLSAETVTSDDNFINHPPDRNTKVEYFESAALAAHAAALYADKAVAAAHSAASLANQSTDQFNQRVSQLRSESRRNSGEFSSNRPIPTEPFTSDASELDYIAPKNYNRRVGDSILQSSRGNESRNPDDMHYSSDEESSARLVNKKLLRRHSCNLPQTNSNGSSGPRFDASSGDETEEESESGYTNSFNNHKLYNSRQISPSSGPPSRPAPSLPRLSTDPMKSTPPAMEDLQDGRRKSLPHVHPKLPDYDSLAARFEALKFPK